LTPEKPLSACEAALSIAAGELKSEDLVASCLARIDECEAGIMAWAHLNAVAALEQAQARDESQVRGETLGPLHGVPVGLKDIIDTADMPTENGSDLFSGRVPDEDATVTRLLRDAGAVIMGKTVTTEFALSGARATRNPRDPLRTPGGSSSGSAAAVASAMVPLSLGSQTGGSMLRPASFCGVYGYKPTFGSISRTGVFILSRRLDHIGVYARTLDDLALISDVLMVHDPNDFEMRYHPGCRLSDVMAEPIGEAPSLGVFKGPSWKFVEDGAVAPFEEIICRLGDVHEVPVMPVVDGALTVHATIMDCSAAANPGRYLDEVDKLLPETAKRIAVGENILAKDYIAAIDKAEVIRHQLDGLFAEVDALITPSAPGEAPIGLQSTGDPVFQKIWTLTGMPTVSLPVMTGPNGLPIGLQVVGRRGCDADLFRVAHWIKDKLS